MTGEALEHSMEKLSHSCGDNLVHCLYGGHKRDCSDLFSTVITDEGQCCAFNVMPDFLMLRNDVVGVRPNWKHLESLNYCVFLDSVG